MKNKFQKLLGATIWECRKRFYHWRYPGAAFLCLLLVTALLPASACRFLDTHARVLVQILNAVLAITVSIGLGILPFSSLSEPYGTPEYEKEQCSDIRVSIRLLARLLANLILYLLMLSAGYLTMWAMDKFGDNAHSYFHISLELEPMGAQTLAMSALFVPMLYLTVFLWQYERDQRKAFVSSYILAFLGGNLALTFLDNLQTIPTLAGFPSRLLWILGMLLLTALCFFRCVRAEERIF